MTMPPALIGEAEEVIGAKPRLHVLEGDVVDRLAAREGMVHVGEHLFRRRPYVELVCRYAERPHQSLGVALRLLARGEARHGVGEDVFSRQAEPVERFRGDDQRVCRIEAAGDADHDALRADRFESLREPGDLDVVSLVAIEREALGIGGHKGKALDLAQKPDICARRVEPERDGAERIRRGLMPATIVVEGTHARPLLAQEVQIDVGEGDLHPGRKPLRLGEEHAVLEDFRLAVPGKVGRRFARACRCVKIGRKAARRLRL